MPKNGLTWDKGTTPQRVFRDAVEKYAGRLNYAVYRMMVTEAPGVQEVLQQVGTWDDNKAEGGDYIRAAAYRIPELHEAGMRVWYDLETYRVLHPDEDPDFEWVRDHIERRGNRASQWVIDIYNEGVALWQEYQHMTNSPVDDRVVETFHDEARFIWDSLLSVLR